MTAAMCSNQQQKATSGSPLLSPPTNHSKFCSFVPIILPIGDYFIFSEDKILNQIERDLLMNFKKKKNGGPYISTSHLRNKRSWNENRCAKHNNVVLKTKKNSFGCIRNAPESCQIKFNAKILPEKLRLTSSEQQLL